jgi:L-aminopeptidase/D-esterase-like protein
VPGRITDVAGITVGHWTDPIALTGCTVVLCPDGTMGSGEVRGGAPGTRETDLLRPGTLVQAVNAVLLTGGARSGWPRPTAWSGTSRSGAWGSTRSWLGCPS